MKHSSRHFQHIFHDFLWRLTWRSNRPGDEFGRLFTSSSWRRRSCAASQRPRQTCRSDASVHVSTSNSGRARPWSVTLFTSLRWSLNLSNKNTYNVQLQPCDFSRLCANTRLPNLSLICLSVWNSGGFRIWTPLGKSTIFKHPRQVSLLLLWSSWPWFDIEAAMPACKHSISLNPAFNHVALILVLLIGVVAEPSAEATETIFKQPNLI